MDRGLSQPSLSELLGANVATNANWELNRGQSLAITLPAIIDFFRYIPQQTEPLFPRLNHPIFRFRVKDRILLKDLARNLGIE